MWCTALEITTQYLESLNRPKICSLHFNEKHFNRSTFKTSLKGDAVPTKNLYFSKVSKEICAGCHLSLLYLVFLVESRIQYRSTRRKISGSGCLRNI